MSPRYGFCLPRTRIAAMWDPTQIPLRSNSVLTLQAPYCNELSFQLSRLPYYPLKVSPQMISSGSHFLHFLVHSEVVQESQDVKTPQQLRIGGRLHQVTLNQTRPGRAGKMAGLLRAPAALSKIQFPATIWQFTTISNGSRLGGVI